MTRHYIPRKKNNTPLSLKIYPRALARCQILQAACSFEINDPSGNFFSGPRLTTLERELILNGAAKATLIPEFLPWYLSAWVVLGITRGRHC